MERIDMMENLAAMRMMSMYGSLVDACQKQLPIFPEGGNMQSISSSQASRLKIRSLFDCYMDGIDTPLDTQVCVTCSVPIPFFSI